MSRKYKEYTTYCPVCKKDFIYYKHQVDGWGLIYCQECYNKGIETSGWVDYDSMLEYEDEVLDTKKVEYPTIKEVLGE